jgi:hypothetical protein
MIPTLKPKSASYPLPSHASQSHARREAGGTDRAGGRELSQDELADVAVTVLALLDFKVQKAGVGRGWIVFSTRDDGPIGFYGPCRSRYTAATKVLAMHGMRVSPMGEIQDIYVRR